MTGLLNKIAVLILIGSWHLTVTAQTSQYQRPKAPPPAEKTEKKDEVATPPNAAPEGDQVDISDLEKKYWSPKDTDFSVVQNRTYKKEKRVSVSGSIGPIINDGYSKGTNGNLAVNYFFEERMGVQFDYTHYNLGNNILTDQLYNEHGAFPDHNVAKRFIGVSFNWVPIYAKVSLLGKRILYFDMFLSGGLGFTTYDQPTLNNTVSQNAITYTVDITQMFFINESLAFRVDAKNQLYQETVVDFRQTKPDRNRGAHNFLLLFGGTFFF